MMSIMENDSMKTKKIIIYYLKGVGNNVATVEKMFATVVMEMSAEGRQIRYINKDSATFEDGTRVEKVPFGMHLLGTRATHIYIDEEILKLKNGNAVVNEVVLPVIVNEGNYKTLDAVGKPIERIMVFNNEGVNKYA